MSWLQFMLQSGALRRLFSRVVPRREVVLLSHLFPPRRRLSQAVTAGNNWREMVAAMQLTGLAPESQHCELRQLSESDCVLRLAPAHGHLQMKPAPERLQQALGDCLGRAISLRFELAQTEVDTPAATVGREKRERQQRAIAAIEQDSFVRMSSKISMPCWSVVLLNQSYNGDRAMMKGGLAGLMKQAQVMQDNMKKAQEQLAQLEVEGQSGCRHGQGGDDLFARGPSDYYRPVGHG